MSNPETGPSPEQKKSASFAELEQKKDVTAKELIETLKDYAESGAGVLARVVNPIIDRVTLSPSERQKLHEIATRGMEKQNKLGQTKDAKEYSLVASHV